MASQVKNIRELAGQISASITASMDQLCREFELEAQKMSNDVLKYQTELSRLMQILRQQLDREHKMYGIFQQMCSCAGRSPEWASTDQWKLETSMAETELARIRALVQGSSPEWQSYPSYVTDLDSARALGQSMIDSPTRFASQAGPSVMDPSIASPQWNNTRFATPPNSARFQSPGVGSPSVVPASNAPPGSPAAQAQLFRNPQPLVLTPFRTAGLGSEPLVPQQNIFPARG
mmetsp:Transcript_35885/g.57166  ORF Transcript_35885/g.57166 Transcript_35885/m.57166 type:complete len:233 (+) Transcript_35885:44-742(+)|eukprot:CAMPEP_0169250824 /NCGR_PEP_ID=MMETSP1016-20121227/37176_1 /TAXON_ID=342587 /ORGANISM="Karlodinium micrum, Strain CCMP2283" /LENGTH=232 /DNA_ID=CAMNT_0009331901 /DNA_START=48 /DNA_END=746 /DNA_ORIENTATION=-